MNSMDSVLIIHLFATIFMTGLCWFVQIVHYPLFRYIRLDNLALYERKNLRTGYIAIPIMLIELFTGGWLLFFDFSLFNIVNVLLIGVIGFSTVIFQGPLHLMISTMPTDKAIIKLINTNWIRTISWTLRCMILGYLLL